MANYRQKPMPEESIYKHLMMLAGYCFSKAEDDTVKKRKDIFTKVGTYLAKFGNGRLVRELQYYGE